MLSICSFRMKPQHAVLAECEADSKPGYYFKIYAKSRFIGFFLSKNPLDSNSSPRAGQKSSTRISPISAGYRVRPGGAALSKALRLRKAPAPVAEGGPGGTVLSTRRSGSGNRQGSHTATHWTADAAQVQYGQRGREYDVVRCSPEMFCFSRLH